MNERIKQLATEARLLTGWSVGEVEYQKFAELIVRDCILALRTSECNVSDLAVEEYTRNRRRIEEHFGVGNDIHHQQV